MKLVYKCDFCSSTYESKKDIEEHESKCSFNPKNKICYTCKFQQDEGAPICGVYTGCSENHDFSDSQEDGIPCDFWMSEFK